MRINNKGVTIVEIIASLALISIILVFLINLFISVRLTYSKSKIKTDYEVINSTIVKAVAHDINQYGLYNCKETNCEPQNNSLTLIFNEFRETQLNERITKTLSIYKENNKYYISYKYPSEVNATSTEKSTNILRELPEVSMTPQMSVRKELNYIEITVPLRDNKGNNYDIHIYGKKEE